MKKSEVITMIRTITKQQFYICESKINPSELSTWDKTIMETMHEFIEDYDDDEITVNGFFDKNDELIGLIQFSEEDLDYLFEDSENSTNNSITLIGALFVHPKYRKNGIGRQLVNFAISEAISEVIVADPLNLEASNFFNKIGFSHENDFGDTDGWFQYKRKLSHNVE
jgi:GNAT superfamily N-acetyltransferase